VGLAGGSLAPGDGSLRTQDQGVSYVRKTGLAGVASAVTTNVHLPATCHRTHGVRYFHGCYSLGADVTGGCPSGGAALR
jgi:hypothetical protein